MIKVRKDNQVYTIKPEQLKEYEKRGFKVVSKEKAGDKK